MRSFLRSHPAKETQIRLFLRLKLIICKIDTVMNGLDLRYFQLLALIIADGGVINFREMRVIIGKHLLISMMHRVNKRNIGETGEAESGSIIQMDDVYSVTNCILNGPCGVIKRLEVGLCFPYNRPLIFLIQPLHWDRKRGFAVRIKRKVHAFFRQATGQLCDKKLSSSILFWRHRNKRRSYDCYSHGLGIKVLTERCSQPAKRLLWCSLEMRLIRLALSFCYFCFSFSAACDKFGSLLEFNRSRFVRVGRQYAFAGCASDLI